jgi:hypothetical protein
VEELERFGAEVAELLETLERLLEVLQVERLLLEDELSDDLDQRDLDGGEALPDETAEELALLGYLVELVDPEDVALDDLQKDVAVEDLLVLQHCVTEVPWSGSFSMKDLRPKAWILLELFLMTVSSSTK